jgi:Fic family protein
MNDDSLEYIFSLPENNINYVKLNAFAKESNIIEGINDKVADAVHFSALESFLQLKKIIPSSLETFVKKIEPKAFLRTLDSHVCYIGGRAAPKPSESLSQLKLLLRLINANEIHPAIAHNEYEFLHPFIDGNGRSGRALWLWQMVKFHKFSFKYPFLQMYYYQSLDRHSYNKVNT